MLQAIPFQLPVFRFRFEMSKHYGELATDVLRWVLDVLSNLKLEEKVKISWFASQNFASGFLNRTQATVWNISYGLVKKDVRKNITIRYFRLTDR